MNEVYYYSEEIDNLIEDYRDILKHLENELSEEKAKKYFNDINFINERIKTAKDVYFIELRNLPEEDKNNHILKLKGKMYILDNLNMEFDHIKSKMIYEKEIRKKSEELIEHKNLTPKEMAMKGDLIQDKTEESIFRMKKMVDESEQMTKDAADKITMQNEKLQEVTDNVDDIVMDISHAKKTLKEIAKGAIADKFVRILSFLILLILIVLVILIAIPRKK